MFECNTLQEALSDDTYRRWLLEFAHKTHTQDSINFLVALQCFHSTVRKMVHEIYSIFIDPLAPQAVNLDHYIKKSIQDQVGSDALSLSIFDQAERTILDLFSSEPFQDFQAWVLEAKQKELLKAKRKSENKNKRPDGGANKKVAFNDPKLPAVLWRGAKPDPTGTDDQILVIPSFLPTLNVEQLSPLEMNLQAPSLDSHRGRELEWKRGKSKSAGHSPDTTKKDKLIESIDTPLSKSLGNSPELPRADWNWRSGQKKELDHLVKPTLQIADPENARDPFDIFLDKTDPGVHHNPKRRAAVDHGESKIEGGKRPSSDGLFHKKRPSVMGGGGSENSDSNILGKPEKDKDKDKDKKDKKSNFPKIL